MISIVSSPPDILPAINEAEYELNTDNFITTAGGKYSTILLNSINPTDGLTLTVAFGSYSETFTFKTTAAGDFDIQLPPSPTSYDTILRANMIAAFSKHYAIISAYQVGTIPGGVFSIEAKETGTAHNITFGGTAWSGGNITYGASQPVNGIDEVRRDNFRIRAEVHNETSPGSGIYELLAREGYTPDDASNIIFDVSELLLALLENDLPSYNQTAPSLCSKNMVRFKIGYGEYYDDGSTEEVHWFRFSDPKRAVYAGLPESQIPGSTFYANHFTDSIGQKYLTGIPRNHIKSNKEAQHYLYYYQRPANANAYFVLYIVYTDNTTSVVDQLFTLAQPGDIMMLPAGYSQLDIDTRKTAGKTVKKWGIEIGANGTDYQDYGEITETFWYTLDDKAHQNNRYFLVGNNYGGYDTLWCNGVAAYAQKAENENYNIYKSGDTATVINATQKTIRGVRQEEITVSTGWKSIEYLKYIAALLCSTTDVFEIVNGQYRAVLIDRSSIKETHNDAQGKFELTFTYNYAQEDKV